MDLKYFRAHTSLDDEVLKRVCHLIVEDIHYQTSWGDGTERNPDAWLQRFKDNLWIPVLWSYQGTPGGFHWLHDFGDHEAGAYTWVGGIVFPEFRGRQFEPLRVRSWRLMRTTFEAIGFVRLFAACLTHNTAGQRWCEQTCGYRRAGIYRDWLLHQGALTDCVLYCMRPQDQGLLWVDAEKRALHVRQIKSQRDNLHVFG